MVRATPELSTRLRRRSACFDLASSPGRRYSGGPFRLRRCLRNRDEPKARRPVLFVLPTLGGGAARVVITLLRHLDRTRFEPHLVVFYTFYGFWFRSEVPDDVVLHVLERPAGAERDAEARADHLAGAPGRARRDPGLHQLPAAPRQALPAVLQARHPRGHRRALHGAQPLPGSALSDAISAWCAAPIASSRRPKPWRAASDGEIAPRPGQVAMSPQSRRRRAPGGGRQGLDVAVHRTGPHVLAMGRPDAIRRASICCSRRWSGVRAAGVPAHLTIVGVGELEAELAAQAPSARARRRGRAGRFPGAARAVLRARRRLRVVVALRGHAERRARGAWRAVCRSSRSIVRTGSSEIVHDGVNGRLLPARGRAGVDGCARGVLRDPAASRRMRPAIPDTLRSFAAPVVSARWNALFRALTEA